MRALTLQDAISELIAKARGDRSVLHVAHDAVRLAKEYGGDSREIAVLITNAGLGARINMEMDMPKPSARGVVNNPPNVRLPVHLPGHLAALAQPPEQVADLVRHSGPELVVAGIEAFQLDYPIRQDGACQAVRMTPERVEDHAL